ncbi:MAG: choice-of-anchor M domain-containing protein, partial [Bifidobacteriaceae bacterium]|nr:choice-of-anchor M domain-containing protein [Bifidobacteriaceae bacterium]
MIVPRRRGPLAPPAALAASAALIVSSLAPGMASAATPGDVTSGNIWVSATPDGSGAYRLVAADAGTHRTLDSPIRIPSSQATVIPDDDGFAWLGESGREGWGLGSSGFSVGFAPIDRTTAWPPYELAGTPVVWRLQDVVAPAGGAYSAYKSSRLADGPLPAVESYHRFGTGAQRDGSPQGTEYLDANAPETVASAQFFTAAGMYCVTYEAELTLPGTDTPTALPITVRYAVGDDVPSAAECGTAQSEAPGSVDQVEGATSGGDLGNDSNEPGSVDQGEGATSGGDLGNDSNELASVPVPASASARAAPPADAADETVDSPSAEAAPSAVRVLTESHVDALYPELLNGGLGGQSLALRARIDQIDDAIDYDNLVIHLGDIDKQRLPARYTDDADYSFIGPEGASIWSAAEEGSDGPWIGAATESPTLAGLTARQPFSFTLEAVTGPGGTARPGDAVVWQSPTPGGIPPMWSTVSGSPSSFVFTFGSQDYFNWSFTAEGVYCMAFLALTTDANGQRLSDAQQLTIAVGSRIDPNSVEPCGRTQSYPQRQRRGYLPSTQAAPVVVPYATSSSIGIALEEGKLDVKALRWLRGTGGKITANRLEDLVFYTAANAALTQRSAARPYPVNMPGWDTSQLLPAAISGGVTFSVENVNGPGTLSADESGRIPGQRIDTANGLTRFDLWTSAADSTRWQVSRPGKYCVAVKLSATTAAGDPVTASALATLVAEGPSDPADLAKGDAGDAPGTPAWLANDHGALDATCAQDPDSWTRADGADGPGGTQTPQWDVPNWSRTGSGATILNLGHVDIASLISGERLVTKIRDTTAEGVAHATEGGASWHDPADVLLQLLPGSRTAVPAGGQWSFLGSPGSLLYQVTQTAQLGLLWPGWSTEAIGADATRVGVDWTMTGISGPGEFALYEMGAFGQPRVLFSTRDGITGADS